MNDYFFSLTYALLRMSFSDWCRIAEEARLVRPVVIGVALGEVSGPEALAQILHDLADEENQ